MRVVCSSLIILGLSAGVASEWTTSDWTKPDISKWNTPESWYPEIQDLAVQCGDFRPQQQIKVGDDGEYACITSGQAICRDNGEHFGIWKFGIDEHTSCVTLWDPNGYAVFSEFCGATHICIGEESNEKSDAALDGMPWLLIHNEHTGKDLAQLTCDGVGQAGIPPQLKMVDNTYVGDKVAYPVNILKFKKGGGSGGENEDNLLWGIDVRPQEGTHHLEGTITVNEHCKWDTGPLPNIVVFLVDDLGYNQVGYHASKTGNHEVQTPSIDKAATSGIQMERGYMTPWCAPSRASFQTGRTNSFNQNVSNDVYSFDESIGFVGGMPPGTVTIAKALKDYSKKYGKGEYKTSYAGKWGIGGTAWANTPMGVGYDEFTGFWGDSIESCDGWQAWTSVPPDFGMDLMANAVPGYWQQSKDSADNVVCPYLKTQDALLTKEEIETACKSTPRTPPKIIDLDLMEQAVATIKNHDYKSGPLYHMHAPQLMHLPLQYPKSYDDTDGAEKDPANNNDIRRTTNNALRFVDDIFGNVTQAVKDAGQWENTIFLFSSDNGGAIYINTVNNNYPLRGSKFNAFEGGLRVPQFLSGGWLDHNLPKKRRNKSGSYVFVNDWAPTLLEMVGADKSYLLGNKEGAPYGNEMWEFIKSSVTPDSPNPKQLQRFVSYSNELFFDVKEGSTHKMIYTNDSGVFVPRHWAPIWPLEKDLIPDLGYQSVNPCRPGGNPLKCCYFDIAADEQEDSPKDVDCDILKHRADSLYYDQEICDEFPTICLSNITQDDDPQSYSIWSHYGASGPFCNKKGQPIDGLNMKCICDGIKDDSLLPGEGRVTQSDVRSFAPKAFAPFICTKDEGIEFPFMNNTIVPLVNCTDGFTRVPQGGLLESYETQGVPRKLMTAISTLPGIAILPELNQALFEYISRKGFLEWPSFAKFPYVGFGLDSCPLKKATIVPLPLPSLTPWIGNAPDGNPTAPTPTNDLCSPWTATKSWCPSKTNPTQKFVKNWTYGRSDAKGFFEDDTLFLPVMASPSTNLSEACLNECAKTPNGTAYIGLSTNRNWGIEV